MRRGSLLALAAALGVASSSVLVAAIAAQSRTKEAPPVERPVERGVSEALAAERSGVITELRYDLRFVIPADRAEPVRGSGTTRLTLKAPHRLVFDFVQPPE